MKFRTRTVIGSLATAAALFMAPAIGQTAQYWQCVPFARLASGIQIFGNAHTWWTQATGKYDTGGAPKVGSVLVFRPKGSMKLGHVAVVDSIATERVITVDHANWSQINGRRGQIEEDVTIVDVSPSADWSQVKVWYDPIGDLGTTVYPTYGFIHQDQKAIALAAAFHGVQTAVGAVSSPVDAISQGADRLSSLIQQAVGSQDRSN
jgi:surface antigen